MKSTPGMKRRTFLQVLAGLPATLAIPEARPEPQKMVQVAPLPPAPPALDALYAHEHITVTHSTTRLPWAPLETIPQRKP